MKHKKNKKHSDKMSVEETQTADKSLYLENFPISKKDKKKQKEAEKVKICVKDSDNEDLLPVHKKKKKHKNKQSVTVAIADKISMGEEQVDSEQLSSDTKSKKNKKRKSDPGLVSNGNEKSSGEKKRKKGKKRKSELNTVSEEESLSPEKKRKKDKPKLSEESSLGVIDTDILQQAETNLGLPMVDNLENQSSAPEDENADNDISSKKSKKKKRKDRKKKMQVATPNEKGRNERVLEYLQQWSTDRKTWKFNKLLQIHLLHIMYDTTLMSDEKFETVLLYLYDLKGKGREKTKEDAKKIIDREEIGAVDAEREERARQIYQILS